ncbi:hypothetical protein AOQ84DRAFT_376928 [Glonium stellatum]|uniref:Uncharacterized protein n=1 Tax=Glonium stellatum TaxID=574774 RepID=A0A8E2F0F9_9PEZI|nr:hypothetical protein AOQ84DRAFT_376928 [Glonium stellatum]
MNDHYQPSQASLGNSWDSDTAHQIESSTTNYSMQRGWDTTWYNPAHSRAPNRDQRIKQLNLELSAWKCEYRRLDLDLLKFHKAGIHSQNFQTDDLDEQKATLELEQQSVDFEIKKIETELDELQCASQTQELSREFYEPASYFSQPTSGSLDPLPFNTQHNIEGQVPLLTSNWYSVPDPLPPDSSLTGQLDELDEFGNLPSGSNFIALDTYDSHVEALGAELGALPGTGTRGLLSDAYNESQITHDMPTTQPREITQYNRLNIALQDGTDWGIDGASTAGDEFHEQPSSNFDQRATKTVLNRHSNLPFKAVESASLSTLVHPLPQNMMTKATMGPKGTLSSRRGQKQKLSILNNSGFQIFRFGPEPATRKRVHRRTTEDRRRDILRIKAEGGACWSCHYGHIRCSTGSPCKTCMKRVAKPRAALTPPCCRMNLADFNIFAYGITISEGVLSFSFSDQTSTITELLIGSGGDMKQRLQQLGAVSSIKLLATLDMLFRHKNVKRILVTASKLDVVRLIFIIVILIQLTGLAERLDEFEDFESKRLKLKALLYQHLDYVLKHASSVFLN